MLNHLGRRSRSRRLAAWLTVPLVGGGLTAILSATPPGGAIPPPGPVCQSTAFFQAFFDTGAAQTFTVPQGVTKMQILADGAQGGDSINSPLDSQGGLGGQAIGTVPVTPGESLQINVGRRGSDAAGEVSPAAGSAGGFNGGAAGGASNNGTNSNPGAGGGGASDVRQGGTALANRIVIGGGGGGAAAALSSALHGTGGAGGGATGGDGTTVTAGSGTATAGGGGGSSTGGTAGAAGASSSPGTAGSSGAGGAGGAGTYGGGGGGGGGLFGGGGGGGSATQFAGGGGGSGFVEAGATDVQNNPGVRPGQGVVQLQWTVDTDLALTKTDGVSNAPPGSTVTYTIVVSNNTTNGITATGANLVDQFPAALTGVTWTAVGDAGTSFTPSGTGDINESVTLPAGKSVTFTATGTVSQSATGTLSNTAHVFPPPCFGDVNNTNDSQTDIDSVTPVADLQVTKTGPATAAPGSDVTYAIAVKNNGPSDVTDAHVSDPLPAGTTFVAATGPGCTTPAVGATGTLDCTVPLASGSSANFTLTIHVGAGAAPGTAINNVATVSSATAEEPVPDPHSNTSTATTTVTCPGTTISGARGATTLSGGTTCISGAQISGAPDDQAGNHGVHHQLDDHRIRVLRRRRRCGDLRVDHRRLGPGVDQHRLRPHRRPR